ncbi:MAG: acyl-CoA dehydrogenase family protein [Novosphingobium sp.]
MAHVARSAQPHLLHRDHEAFRDTVRRFVAADSNPMPHGGTRRMRPARGLAQGRGLELLCPTVPETYGGLGARFGYNAVIDREIGYGTDVATGFSLQSDIVANYIIQYGSEEQKQTWLPKMVSGEVITAIAMTEPGTGSDLQGLRTTARKDGNHYVISGSRTYITNGQNADRVVCCKTDTEVQPAWKRPCRSCGRG